VHRRRALGAGLPADEGGYGKRSRTARGCGVEVVGDRCHICFEKKNYCFARHSCIRKKVFIYDFKTTCHKIMLIYFQ
jgi:hypothetical protein